MTNRVVVVTGSTSGIGEGIARRFAQGGDHVVIHGLDEEGASDTAARLEEQGPGRVLLVMGDITDVEMPEQLVAKTVREFGSIDVLVNNAGRNVFTGVMESTLDDWQHALDLNLRAPWLCSKASAPHMPIGGSIITIASKHAYATMPGCFPYNVAKAGLLGLTTALAVEFAPLGIRANTICPGWTDTPAVRAEFVAAAEGERDRVEALHLTGRIGHPREIGEAAWYLANAGQVTGTHLIVDGGRSALMEDPR